MKNVMKTAAPPLMILHMPTTTRIKPKRKLVQFMHEKCVHELTLV
jgi:hypothetical protein